MKKLYFFAVCCALLLGLVPSTGYGQCSNQVTIGYTNAAGAPSSQTINNGQSGTAVAVCPTAGALYNFTGSSTSDAVMTWARVITRGATSATDVLDILNTASVAQNTNFNLTVSFANTTTLRLQSNAGAYPGGNCNGKDGVVYLTFTPSLTLASPGAAGVCAGASTTLTATGSATGTYAWAANGVTIPNQTGSTITVAPTATTTYSVAATTAACGTSSQQLTIPVFELRVAPAAPTVCANQATTLTASYTGTGATYRWTELGQATALSTAATLTVTPGATTTYQVTATTADCGTLTRNVTVTVGTATVAVAPAAVTSCAGGATTLTAASTNPAATYTWSPATGLSATTGAVVTATPTTTTTYTVTGNLTTSGGCTNTRQMTVTVVAPLPVSLVAFEARWTSRQPHLTWATAAEQRNAYFDVERSLDGNIFEAVGRRAGMGSTTARTTYEFDDASLPAAAAGRLVYYRLRQVDVGGEASYSSVRTVMVPASLGGFQAVVFPNPSENAATVRFRAPGAGVVGLTLRNVLGQVLAADVVPVSGGEQDAQLPWAAGLPAGLYYLTLQQGAQQQRLPVVRR